MKIHDRLISFATAFETLTAVNILNILFTNLLVEQFLQARAQPSASLRRLCLHREIVRCESAISDLVKYMLFS